MIESIGNCFLLYSLSSLGFMLIFIPFTIKVISSSTFSISFDYSDKDYIKMKNIFSSEIRKNLFLSEKTSACFDSKSCNDDVNATTIKYSCNEETSEIYDSSSSIKDNLNNEKNKKQSNKDIYNKSIFQNYIYRAYIKIIVTFSLFIFFFTINIIYFYIIKKESIMEIEMTNGLFAYKCPIEKMFIYTCMMEFIFLMYGIVSFQKIINARYIYFDCKIISIIILVWIIIDPGINVIQHFYN